LTLASGSLLLMKGDTQRHWRHGLPRETRPCGPRLNLTFRRIFPGS
jgi:alkylated DNA repair dioxygenase AlkB